MPPQEPQPPARPPTVQERAIGMLRAVSDRMRHGRNPYNERTEQAIVSLLQDQRTAEAYIAYMEASTATSKELLKRGWTLEQAAEVAASERWWRGCTPISDLLKRQENALKALQTTIRDRRPAHGIDAEEFAADQGAALTFVKDIGLAHGTQEAERLHSETLQRQVIELSQRFRSEVEAVRTAAARGQAGQRDYTAAMQRLRSRVEGQLEEMAEHDRLEIIERMASGTQQQPGQQQATQPANGISDQVAAAARSAASGVGNIAWETAKAAAAQTVHGGSLLVTGAGNLLGRGSRGGNGGGGPTAA